MPSNLPKSIVILGVVVMGLCAGLFVYNQRLLEITLQTPSEALTNGQAHARREFTPWKLQFESYYDETLQVCVVPAVTVGELNAYGIELGSDDQKCLGKYSRTDYQSNPIEAYEWYATGYNLAMKQLQADVELKTLCLPNCDAVRARLRTRR